MDIDIKHKEDAAFQQWYDQYRLESLRHGYGPDATLKQHPHWSTGFESHMKLAWMARATTAPENTQAVDELIKEIEDLRAAVKEWLCESCNFVYPGPPQPGFACVQCPRCEGMTGPRPTMELRKANKTIKEACEYLRRSAALIAMSGDQSMALAVARNADRIERGEPQPSIRKRCMSRANAQQAFDAMERAYWSSVEIVDGGEPIISTEQLRQENQALRNLANNLQPGPISEALGGAEHEKPFRLAAGFEVSETGSFTDALKDSSDVREQRMARGTLPKD